MILPLLVRTHWKTLLRNRFSFVLTIATVPLLIVFFRLFFGAHNPQLRVRIRLHSVQQESRTANRISHAQTLVQRWEGALTNAGIRLRQVGPGEKNTDLVVTFPDRYDERVGRRIPQTFQVVVRHQSPVVGRGLALLQTVVQGYGRQLSGVPALLRVQQSGKQGNTVVRRFDRFVPGLLVFSIIMLVFSVAIGTARSLESGTPILLSLAGVGFQRAALSLALTQLLLGFLSLGLAYLAAMVCGFRSQGPLPVAMLLSLLAAVSCVALGMLVAAVSRSVQEAFLLSSLMMFLLILFSGLLFPQPRLALFSLAGQSVDLFELLPTSRLRTGFHTVLVEGGALAEVSRDLMYLGTGALVSGGVAWLVLRLRSRRLLEGGNTQ